MVVYYPYFVAQKSGTLNIHLDKIIIEAVKDDLWNLVTDQKLDVSLIITKTMILLRVMGKKIF